ncbi:MAG: prevent-host-death protein [Geobacteraceae bacterium GWC2_58_44]|nr:MAG: prevent-host-death protein [Geobacteraceae bacterium GWC2_58_44]HBG05743.1 type II toxin-antitoxin system prevent-host-death family antitoxin [Geobacter sp.]
MKSDKRARSPHDREWQLQEAKNRLSQVLDSALHNGPQTITLRGKPAAVVVSFEEFRKLSQPRTSLSQFFKQSPLSNLELDLVRSDDVSREVEL